MDKEQRMAQVRINARYRIMVKTTNLTKPQKRIIRKAITKMNLSELGAMVSLLNA